MTALTRVWKCQADVSKCAVLKNLTLRCTSKCVYASPVHIVSTLHLFGFQFRLKATTVILWHQDSDLAKFISCATKSMFKQDHLRKITISCLNFFSVTFNNGCFYWLLEGILPWQPSLIDKLIVAGRVVENQNDQIILKLNIWIPCLAMPLMQKQAQGRSCQNTNPTLTPDHKVKYTFPQRSRITTGFYF